VSVPPPNVVLPNTAPLVQNAINDLFVFAEVNQEYTVGTPYDMQMDSFVLAEWGVRGEAVPSWISFKNETTLTAVQFKMHPTSEHIGLKLKLYYVLLDLNARPESSEFEFTVTVVESANNRFESAAYNHTIIKPERQPEIIKVTVEAPDSEGNFIVRFSKEISLPTNCSQWSDLNEGKDRLKVRYDPTEETQTLLYEQDLKVEMHW